MFKIAQIRQKADFFKMFPIFELDLTHDEGIFYP